MSGTVSGGAGWLDDVLRWLRECATRLAHVADGTGRTAERVQRCWVDERGREWVERAGLVRRQLERDAAECAELADRIARAAAVEPARAAEEPPAGPAAPGPQLGSTAARRTDAARGIRIAILSEEERGSTSR